MLSGTCQYPLTRSQVLKYLLSARASKLFVYSRHPIGSQNSTYSSSHRSAKTHLYSLLTPLENLIPHWLVLSVLDPKGFVLVALPLPLSGTQANRGNHAGFVSFVTEILCLINLVFLTFLSPELNTLLYLVNRVANSSCCISLVH